MSTGDTGSSSSETAKAEERKEKKRLWDIILTATPVALTVLATALASFSNKEMTKAQYFRATAAQNQSKVGDQWAFFQAKRVRTTVQQQRADRGAFDETYARSLADRLPILLKRLDGETNEIFAKLDGEPAELKPALQQLREAIAQATKEIEATKQAILAKLDNSDAKKDLLLLTAESLPVPQDADPKATPRKLVRDAVKAVEAKNGVKPIKKGTKEIDPSIEKAFDAIDGRKPRAEYEADVLAIKGDVLRQAIEAAEAESKKYDDASRSASRLFDDLGKLLVKQKEVLRPVGRAALKLTDAVEYITRSVKNSGRADVLALATSAERLDLSTRNLCESLTSAAPTLTPADSTVRRVSIKRLPVSMKST